MLIWIVLIVVVVLLVIVAVVGFNRLRTADVGAQEALGGIDVQLTRRAIRSWRDLAGLDNARRLDQAAVDTAVRLIAVPA